MSAGSAEKSVCADSERAKKCAEPSPRGGKLSRDKGLISLKSEGFRTGGGGCDEEGLMAASAPRAPPASADSSSKLSMELLI